MVTPRAILPPDHYGTCLNIFASIQLFFASSIGVKLDLPLLLGVLSSCSLTLFLHLFLQLEKITLSQRWGSNLKTNAGGTQGQPLAMINQQSAQRSTSSKKQNNIMM